MTFLPVVAEEIIIQNV